MAIVVLVLWLFTAGAGFSLLVTGNLGRSRPGPQPGASSAPSASSPPEEASAPVAPAAVPVPVTSEAPVTPAAAAAPAVSKREMRREARSRFDPPSLTEARKAPIMPGLRSLLEFAHPALALIGLGFWLGFTLVHNHVLGWIAFGLVTATIGLGLTWFAANARAGKRVNRGEVAPSFGLRLVVLHGGAAAVTFALAALTALVMSR